MLHETVRTRDFEAGLIFSFGLLLFASAANGEIVFSGEKKLNNFVSELLEVSSISQSSQAFTFTRKSDGWIFISASCTGTGTTRLILDQQTRADTVIVHNGAGEAKQCVIFPKARIQSM